MRFMISLLVLFISSCAYAQDVKTYIPEKAWSMRDDLYISIERNIKELPDYNFVPALIEHESCISLKYSRCWNPNSTLSNSREHSVGFFQIAKTYDKHGNVSMDTLRALKNKYKTQLKDLTWANIVNRPDLQLEAGTLLIKDNWNYFRNKIPDPMERMHFVDAAHNSGAGNVNSDIRACSLVAGCDPTKWFGHVEKTCTRSKVAISQYKRSPCEINRNHVTDVFKVRKLKYNKQYYNEEYLKTKGK